MPRRRPGWTRFSVRKRDQTGNLENFHESINLGNALEPIDTGEATECGADPTKLTLGWQWPSMECERSFDRPAYGSFQMRSESLFGRAFGRKTGPHFS